MSTKKICVVSATRAEYGLLKPLIKGLSAIGDFDVKLAVTGAHLSSAFGSTYMEIEKDGFSIDKKIEILSQGDAPSDISKAMALALAGFADYFASARFDLLILLGDRYETIAVALAAMNQRIPIAHLYGGETTEGAVDESIRHAITKLSYLHFTSTEAYRQRVIQLGEDPGRVFSVGALGIENILSEKLLDKTELAHELGLSLDAPYAMVTFHPVTLENASAKQQLTELLKAIGKHTEMTFIISKANADADGRIINAMLEDYALEHKHVHVFASLGMRLYLSALKHCAFVLGNSSSGLIEAPSFGVPVINVGDRQKGRLQADNVIDCEPRREALLDAIETALSPAFVALAKKAVNPYGDGQTSQRIIATLRRVLSQDKIDLKKSFFDIGRDET
jgi:GDP/UDP-N,N'-diacetylbacillosamine 2-epimerase (hydrolysing)